MPVDTETVIDVLHRIATVREMRCGGSAWVTPPIGWGTTVQQAWSTVYFRPPNLPDGWVDIVLAMSEHIYEIDAGVRIIDAFENALDGTLQLRSSSSSEASFEEIKYIVDAYELVSETTCTVCSAAGILRQEGESFRSTVLCDRHAGEKL